MRVVASAYFQEKGTEDCWIAIVSFVWYRTNETAFSAVLIVSLLFPLCSFFSTNLCGSSTCWSGSSPAWFCISYTLCCAPSAGTTLCLWALFSAATTMSFLNCCETALCWAKPTPTLCPPTAWASSHSELLLYCQVLLVDPVVEVY